MINDLRNRGVQDILLAAIDGLSGFINAIHAMFPETRVQRCIIHQIRNSLRYVVWKDRMAFMADLKMIYQAATQENAEANLIKLDVTWGEKYRAAVRSWQNKWEDLSTFFELSQEIHRLIYTTNTAEGHEKHPLPLQRRWAALESVSTGALSSAPTHKLYPLRDDISMILFSTTNVKELRKEKTTLNRAVFVSKES